MAGRILGHAVAAAAAGDRRRGLLIAAGLVLPCSFGEAGVHVIKREGDGATPRGSHRLVAALYRADRMRRPQTHLPVTAILPDMGWCDAPDDKRYNRPVRLPYGASHERLWRADRLYDLVAVFDYNLLHPRRRRGSAIFLHVAGPGLAPTAGCVATTLAGLTALLARWGPATRLIVR